MTFLWGGLLKIYCNNISIVVRFYYINIYVCTLFSDLASCSLFTEKRYIYQSGFCLDFVDGMVAKSVAERVLKHL